MMRIRIITVIDKIMKFVKDSLQSLFKTPEEYEYASLERNADQKLGFIKTPALIR
jgi:hypothetical protein